MPKKAYQCDMCESMGLRQFCYEHKKYHGHGLVHLEKSRNGVNAWWLCNKCAEEVRP